MTNFMNLWNSLGPAERINLAVALFTAVAALAACVATWYARGSAVEARKAAAGALLANLHTQYSSPEMHCAMQALGEFHDRDSTTTEKRFLKERYKRTDQGRRLETYRRRVTFFIIRLAGLKKLRFLDVHELGIAFGPGPFRFYVKFMEPFERAHLGSLNRDYDPELEEFCRTVLQREFPAVSAALDHSRITNG